MDLTATDPKPSSVLIGHHCCAVVSQVIPFMASLDGDQSKLSHDAKALGV